MFTLNALSINAAQERAADLVRDAQRERRLATVDPPLTDQLIRRARALTRWRARWGRRPVRLGGPCGLPTPGGA